MSTTRQLAVGIDVQGADAVIVIERPRDGSLHTERVALEDLSSRIPAAARVGVCLPLRESVGRWLETPLTSPAKARKVFPSVLDIQLPFALEECEYDFVAERKGPDGKIQALAVAARHPAIEAALLQWSNLGVDPDMLDHEGLALWVQALKEQPVSRADTAGLRAVVYVGVDRGRIALGRGREFVNSHTCVLEEPAGLRRLLRAAFGDPLPSIEWVWCGPGADDPAFEATRLELESLAPGPATTVDEPAAFLARALAARVSGRGLLPCNFRAGRFADARQAEASSRTLNRLAAGLVLVGVLLWGSAFACGHLSARAVRSAQDRFFTLYHRVAGTPASGAQGEHAVTLARRALEERREHAAELESLLRPSLTQPLFEIISAVDPAAMQIHECRLSAAKWLLVGHANNRADAQALEALAAGAGFDAELQWGGTTADADPNDFVLTTREKP